MIELAVLGLLHAQDRHGYDLRKRMADLGEGAGVSYGSLYPALSRLERNGYVRAVTPGRAAGAGLTGPMTGAITGELAALRHHRKAGRATDPSRSHQAEAEGAGGRRADKRNRKVYRITDRGRQRFDELLRTADPADERAFAMQVTFCRHLPAADRLALFARRRAALVDQLDAARRRAGETAADPYVASRRRHDAETIGAQLAWVDELVELTAAPTTDPAPEPSRRLSTDPTTDLTTTDLTTDGATATAVTTPPGGTTP